MSSDLRQPRGYHRALLAIGSLAIALFAACFVAGTPSFAASSSADLSATLANKMAVPGHRVYYVVAVTNHGPSTAKRVQIDFFTSSALGSVRWSNKAGRCIRSSKETACLFGTLKVGQTVTASISGIVSKSLKKGTAISNHVVLGSDTHLINTGNDTVTDNYRLGIPNTVPTTSVSTGPPAETKIDRITHVASDTISATHTALVWSIVTLGAAAIWFAVGLTLKARKRRKHPTPEYD